MNLQTLFKTQAELDKKIVEEKGLQGQDLLDKKILALQVELGELANEWRGFKFWSHDQKPNLISFDLKSEYKKEGGVTGFDKSGIRRVWIDGVEIPFQEIDEYIEERRPLLEEYVDCLHFILSIGLELGANAFLQGQSDWTYMAEKDIVRLFQNLFVINWDILDDDGHFEYFEGFEYFMTLGRELGFTWDEIEQAYIEKNKINQERQVTGY